MAAISAGDYRAAGKTGIQTLLIAVATAITLGEGAAALAGGKGAGTAAIANAEAQAVKEAAKEGGSLAKVNGRNPINSRYAADTHPSGVKFNEQGFPRFEPHAKARVKLNGLTGDYPTDAAMANKALGLQSVPDGMVWHHVEDGKTMLLIPQEIHQAARHTGGAAIIRSNR